MTISAEAALADLRAWLARNGWAGYDPYDIRGTPLFLALQRLGAGRPRLARLPLRAAAELAQRFPRATRRALNVQPAINAHGVALLAAGYWTLPDADAHADGDRCLDWLAANAAPDVPGLGWGYPFDWQSLTFIPRGTPSGFVSVVAGDAFWRAGRLDACAGVCEFLTRGLNRAETDDGVCFSYTTADELRVHNTNLLAAEFLDRVGRERGEQSWIDLAERAASFTLAEQRADGAIDYWSRTEPRPAPTLVDHYHTGNALRSLHGLWRRSRDERYRDARDRLHAYYRRELWDGDRPLTQPGRVSPVDIHGCAEAILCNTLLASEIDAAAELADAAVRWTLAHMRRADGTFGHLLVRRFGREVLTGIPYLRWSQAPMLLALASTL